MSQIEEKKIQLGWTNRLPPLTQKDLPDAPNFWTIAGPGWISAADVTEVTIRNRYKSLVKDMNLKIS
jgi:hypothetical protein